MKLTDELKRLAKEAEAIRIVKTKREDAELKKKCRADRIKLMKDAGSTCESMIEKITHEAKRIASSGRKKDLHLSLPRHPGYEPICGSDYWDDDSEVFGKELCRLLRPKLKKMGFRGIKLVYENSYSDWERYVEVSWGK